MVPVIIEVSFAVSISQLSVYFSFFACLTADSLCAMYGNSCYSAVTTVLHLCAVGKLNMHLRIHRSATAKHFKCSEAECQKMFFSSEGLRRHKLTHLGIHV